MQACPTNRPTRPGFSIAPRSHASSASTVRFGSRLGNALIERMFSASAGSGHADGAPSALGRRLRRDSSLQNRGPGSCGTNSQTVNGQPSDRCCRIRLAACRKGLERAKGIEPSYAAWEAAVLPLNYARNPSGLPLRPAGAGGREISRRPTVAAYQNLPKRTTDIWPAARRISNLFS
jgi:hypothetical protein